jgi:hypothetical protein
LRIVAALESAQECSPCCGRRVLCRLPAPRPRRRPTARRRRSEDAIDQDFGPANRARRNLRRGGIRRQHRDHVGSEASADVRLSAPGVGWWSIRRETGKNIGPYAADVPTFHIPGFGGGLAPNTPITLTITTYSGPSLTGSIAFVSTLVFDCTTGVVIEAPAIGPTQSIPALSPAAIAALIALIVLLGASGLRRPAQRRASRRRFP